MSEKILNDFKSKLNKATNLADLSIVEKEFFGDQGYIKQALSELKNLSAEQKRVKGPQIQSLKTEVLSLIELKKSQLTKVGDTENLKNDSENLSPFNTKIGHLHPLTETVKMMNGFFASMGYSVMDGPEIESDEYCFQRLKTE